VAAHCCHTGFAADHTPRLWLAALCVPRLAAIDCPDPVAAGLDYDKRFRKLIR
jgi:hypothetical protein